MNLPTHTLPLSHNCWTFSAAESQHWETFRLLRREAGSGPRLCCRKSPVFWTKLDLASYSQLLTVIILDSLVLVLPMNKSMKDVSKYWGSMHLSRPSPASSFSRYNYCLGDSYTFYFISVCWNDESVDVTPSLSLLHHEFISPPAARLTVRPCITCCCCSLSWRVCVLNCKETAPKRFPLL